MTAYPQPALCAATFLHLCHGEWHAVPEVEGPGGASWKSGERGKGGLFCAVWLCRTDGIKSSQLATSTGLFHRSITSRSVVFLLQLKMWFTPHHAVLYHIWDSGYQHGHNHTKVRVQQGQYPVLSCGNQIRAIRCSVGSSSAIFAGGVPSCSMSSFNWVWILSRRTTLSPFCILCNLIALYSLCCFTRSL